MSAYRFGDVVLVPFPFTDQTAAKQRPAVVVSSETYHRSTRDVMVMAITSQVHATVRFGEALLNDWESANLLKPSCVKPLIATIEQRLVRKSLGRLSDADQKRLRDTMHQVMG
jgi:mRNA interferase MazF